uniref:Uncharacterized protein n=1 Tax=Heterorhabditis bacteriophora TaxID=37862 RepID=A0A1I7WD79_HETBA
MKIIPPPSSLSPSLSLFFSHSPLIF